MQVVILAAGAGKRLKNLALPKPLTPLKDGSTIIGRQLQLLEPYVSSENITLVVGYQKEKIIDRFPSCHFVENPSFASENTSKSLLRAIQAIPEEDLLWLNGDVVFRPNALETILACKKTSMLVNKTKVGSEEVKYRTDRNGRILEVSKEVLEPDGEALGINFFQKKDLKLLTDSLQLCKNEDYFEKAIQYCIDSKAEVWSVPVGTQDCVEVDFPEDLKKANAIV